MNRNVNSNHENKLEKRNGISTSTEHLLSLTGNMYQVTLSTKTNIDEKEITHTFSLLYLKRDDFIDY